jgi:hypothetical protein
MIRPHDVKIHLGVARSLQETVIESALQIRPAVALGIVVPVPIIDEGVHAIFKGCLDPFLNHDRIVIHLVAPERLAGLVMLRETLVSLLDDFPLPYSFFPEPLVGKRIVVARRPDVSADIDVVIDRFLRSVFVFEPIKAEKKSD